METTGDRVLDRLADRLRACLRQQDAIVVVGAGVSINATGGAPEASWTGLLRSGIERCEELVPDLPGGWGDRMRTQIDVGDDVDLLAAASQVTMRLKAVGAGSGQFAVWLRETVGSLQLEDGELLRAIGRLGVPIVTTNYDDLLEQVIGRPAVTMQAPDQVERAVNGQEEAIVHLHGHWRTPASVVLGLQSYTELTMSEPAQAIARALPVGRSLVLIGFGNGINDPTLGPLREWMGTALADSQIEHFRLVNAEERQEAQRLHQDENIRVIEYGPSFASLTSFVASLGPTVFPEEPATASPHHRPFMAPDHAANVVARPEPLDRIVVPLIEPSDETTGHDVVMHGNGGFGKTTLAIEVCHDERVRQFFSDGVLWVTIGQTPELVGQVTKLYDALTGTRPRFVDIEDATLKLGQALAGRRCLIVVDDVWHVHDVQPFVQPEHPSRCLVTTRVADVASAIAGTVVAIGEMTMTEAGQVLTNHLPEDLRSTAIVEHVSGALGAWPLLLELAASYARKRVDLGDRVETAFDAVVATLEREGPDAFDQRNANDRRLAVALTVDLGLALLESAERSRFEQMAVFLEDVDVPISAVATLWEVEPVQAELLLIQCANLSLCTLRLGPRVVRLHDEIRTFLVDRIRGQLPEIHRRLVRSWGDLHVVDEQYALDHAVDHLIGAGDADGLFRLIDQPWMGRKLEATSSHQSFATDVLRAADLASKLSPRAVHEEFRCTCIHANLSSSARSMSPRELGLLAVSGQLDPALGYVSLLEDAEAISAALLGIIEAMVDTGETELSDPLDRAESATYLVADQNRRAWHLARLAVPMLAAGTRLDDAGLGNRAEQMAALAVELLPTTTSTSQLTLEETYPALEWMRSASLSPTQAACEIADLFFAIERLRDLSLEAAFRIPAEWNRRRKLLSMLDALIELDDSRADQVGHVLVEEEPAQASTGDRAHALAVAARTLLRRADGREAAEETAQTALEVITANENRDWVSDGALKELVEFQLEIDSPTTALALTAEGSELMERQQLQIHIAAAVAESGDADEALAIAEHNVEGEPDDADDDDAFSDDSFEDPVGEALIAIAIALGEAGQVDRAAEIFQHSDNEELRAENSATLADVLLRGGRRADALELLRESPDVQIDTSIHRLVASERSLTKQSVSSVGAGRFESARSQVLTDVACVAAESGDWQAARDSLDLITVPGDRRLGEVELGLHVARHGSADAAELRTTGRAGSADAPGLQEWRAATAVLALGKQLADAGHAEHAAETARIVVESVALSDVDALRQVAAVFAAAGFAAEARRLMPHDAAFLAQLAQTDSWAVEEDLRALVRHGYHDEALQVAVSLRTSSDDDEMSELGLGDEDRTEGVRIVAQEHVDVGSIDRALELAARYDTSYWADGIRADAASALVTRGDRDAARRIVNSLPTPARRVSGMLRVGPDGYDDLRQWLGACEKMANRPDDDNERASLLTSLARAAAEHELPSEADRLARVVIALSDRLERAERVRVGIDVAPLLTSRDDAFFDDLMVRLLHESEGIEHVDGRAGIRVRLAELQAQGGQIDSAVDLACQALDRLDGDGSAVGTFTDGQLARSLANVGAAAARGSRIADACRLAAAAQQIGRRSFDSGHVMRVVAEVAAAAAASGHDREAEVLLDTMLDSIDSFDAREGEQGLAALAENGMSRRAVTILEAMSDRLGPSSGFDDRNFESSVLAVAQAMAAQGAIEEAVVVAKLSRSRQAHGDVLVTIAGAADVPTATSEEILKQAIEVARSTPSDTRAGLLASIVRTAAERCSDDEILFQSLALARSSTAAFYSVLEASGERIVALCAPDDVVALARGVAEASSWAR